MAKLVQCDRCQGIVEPGERGAEHPEQPFLVQLTQPKANHESSFRDLCYDCAMDFQKWLDAGTSEA